MELANIEQLIEKYENAETSLKEEAILKDYFSQEDVAPHLYEYKALFSYFEESSSERFTKTIPLKRKSPNLWWLSIAASVLIVFGVFFVNNSSSELSKEEQREAELALAETKKAFQLISNNMNKGNNVAIAGLGEFDKAHGKVFK